MKIPLLLNKIKVFFSNNTTCKIDMILSAAILLLLILSSGKCSTIEKVEDKNSAKINNLWFKVNATRIGLIGNTTASGHIIEEKDIFVALPDRSALNRMVKVKYKDRIVCCKVLDVGPWSTKDNYWETNSRPLSESKKQLPERDREVKNNAGIDLSDGLWKEFGIPSEIGIVSVEWSFVNGD